MTGFLNSISGRVTGASPIHRTKKAEKQAAAALVLRKEIEQTKVEIDRARNHFEQVVDPTLIDCYIYELNAAQLRYQFLLRRFKNQEI